MPLKTATTDTTIHLLREIFARFGIPHCVVSDNGPQFSSAAMAKFMRENSIRHVRTAPYHPQSNGLAERAVRTIKEGLKKNKRGTLQEKLSRFLFRYRSTPLESGKSPAQLLLGFEPRTRLSAHFPAGEVPAEAEATREQPSSAKTPPLFPPGKPIWSRQFQQGQKWLPGTVVATEGNRMVKVETTLGTQRRHVDQLRARLTSTTPEKNTSSVRTSSAETQPDTDAREDRATLNSSPATPQSAVSTRETGAPEAVPTQLRRSTRTRRPPERLGF